MEKKKRILLLLKMGSVWALYVALVISLMAIFCLVAIIFVTLWAAALHI
jgi:hypothetical protein